MYILKNALTSIVRNKGRNILIIIIVTVIAAACAITLAIKNSADTIVTAYENKYNIEATISFNRSNLMQNFEPGKTNEENIETFNNIESITIDEINNYGNSNYVDYFYYTYSVGMNSNDLEVATEQLQKTTTETTIKENFPGGFGGMGGGSKTTKTKIEEIFNMRGTNGDFTLVGYSSYEGMSDFINGNYTIVEGEVNSDFNSNNCVINKELATLNEIAVGDTITLVSTANEKSTYDLIVTGIYTDNSEESTNLKQMYSNSVNNIITNSNLIQTIIDDNEDTTATITPTFILKSKNDIDQFTSEVETKGLSENYEVTTNLDEITSETESISNVASFANVFLIITLIIGGIVLLIINMINLRERKYEIGVLRTIGMKKSIVTLEFTAELIIISLIGLLLGAVIGASSSVKIANKMLENEITSSDEVEKNMNNNFGKMIGIPNDQPTEENSESETRKISGIVKVEQVDSINAVVNLKVLLELLLIGIGLTMFSSLSTMINIARFSPLTILKERS